MGKYKYLHIVPQDGGGNFISNLINSFLNNECETSIDQHFWITWDKELFETYRQKIDIIHVYKSPIVAINKYGKNSEWIFLHGISFPSYKLLFINRSCIKKIVWRTWGHDIKTRYKKSKNFFKYCYYSLNDIVLRIQARRFKLIGVANIVDEIKIRRAFGNDVKYLRMPYTGGKEINLKKRALVNKCIIEKKKTPFLHIMVGHSGHEEDNHIAIIERLKPYLSENIFLSIMIPYGDCEYSALVKRYVKETIQTDKYQLVDKKIPYSEYVKFISSIDVAILDMVNSAALGNLSLLLLFNKKLYLRKGGDIYSAFQQCGLLCGTTEEIGRIPFDVFSSSVVYDKRVVEDFTSYFMDEDYGRKQWDSIFEYLEYSK